MLSTRSKRLAAATRAATSPCAPAPEDRARVQQWQTARLRSDASSCMQTPRPCRIPFRDMCSPSERKRVAASSAGSAQTNSLLWHACFPGNNTPPCHRLFAPLTSVGRIRSTRVQKSPVPFFPPFGLRPDRCAQRARERTAVRYAR